MANFRYSYQKQNYREERKFEVIIDKGEMCQIKEWVLKHDNIETGGDLFGLWIDAHTAVVQFVLGPGKGCRRTSVSFYQDINYLESAGKYFTKNYGLCNIGQWHSHHRLNLSRPSGGDENTVWGNMPSLCLNRYIVFIATITGDCLNPIASVKCFLFETDKRGKTYPVLEGKFKILKGMNNSPFRLDDMILNKIEIGAENLNKIMIFKKSTLEVPARVGEKLHFKLTREREGDIYKLKRYVPAKITFVEKSVVV